LREKRKKAIKKKKTVLTRFFLLFESSIIKMTMMR
jgi:hypothetical protein